MVYWISVNPILLHGDVAKVRSTLYLTHLATRSRRYSRLLTLWYLVGILVPDPACLLLTSDAPPASNAVQILPFYHHVILSSFYSVQSHFLLITALVLPSHQSKHPGVLRTKTICRAGTPYSILHTTLPDAPLDPPVQWLSTSWPSSFQHPRTLPALAVQLCSARGVLRGTQYGVRVAFVGVRCTSAARHLRGASSRRTSAHAINLQGLTVRRRGGPFLLMLPPVIRVIVI